MLAIRSAWRRFTALVLAWLHRAVLAPLTAWAALAAYRAREGARTDAVLAQMRMKCCEKCPFYAAVSRSCRKCGCFMPMKVRLPSASCPIGRWGPA